MKITAPASVPEEGLANAPPPAPAYSEADSKLPALSRFQPQLALFILGAGVAARGM